MTTLELILTLAAGLVGLSMILRALPAIHEARAGAKLAELELLERHADGVPQDEVANLAIAVAQETARRVAGSDLAPELRDRLVATVIQDVDRGAIPPAEPMDPDLFAA